MSVEPSKHLHPLPVPAKASAGSLSYDGLSKLCQKLSGVEPPNLQMELVREVAETLSFASYLDGNEAEEKIAAALLRLEQIQPRDPMEGMLGAQMVATHGVAMDCLRRAVLPSVTREERQAELRQAEKFLQLYPHQLETLDKHRRGNGRTVTHKHEVSHSYDAAGKAEVPIGAADGAVEQVPQLTKTETVQIDLSALQSRVGVRAGGQM